MVTGYYSIPVAIGKRSMSALGQKRTFIYAQKSPHQAGLNLIVVENVLSDDLFMD